MCYCRLTCVVVHASARELAACVCVRCIPSPCPPPLPSVNPRPFCVFAPLLPQERSQGSRPVSLIGYSLGARVVFTCCAELARRGEQGLGIVQDGEFACVMPRPHTSPLPCIRCFPSFFTLTTPLSPAARDSRPISHSLYWFRSVSACLGRSLTPIRCFPRVSTLTTPLSPAARDSRPTSHSLYFFSCVW